MNISQRPFFTAQLPGVGGTIKCSPQDFVVEEIPAYEPCGEGEHLYLWVEKVGMTSEQMVRALAQHFEVSQGQVGVAGTKDRHAITRQWVSIAQPSSRNKSADEFVKRLSDNLQVIEARWHRNKLKTGHLKGNRFQIVIRELAVEPEQALARVREIAAQLSAHGLPNYYGLQRFGRHGSTLKLGIDLLKNSRATASELKRRPRMKRMAISSVQSNLFNAVLASRIQRNTWRTVLSGDVMQKTTTGGIFVVKPEECEDTQVRLEQGEVVITGPMWGSKMRRAEGDTALLEMLPLDEAGLSIEAFSKYGRIAEGTRRPLSVNVENFECEITTEGPNEVAHNALKLVFSLPAGSYATVLLREFMKDSPEDNLSK